MVVPRHPGEVGILAPAETGELKAILGASPSGTTLKSGNFTTDPFSGSGAVVLAFLDSPLVGNDGPCHIWLVKFRVCDKHNQPGRGREGTGERRPPSSSSSIDSPMSKPPRGGSRKPAGRTASAAPNARGTTCTSRAERLPCGSVAAPAAATSPREATR